MIETIHSASPADYLKYQNELVQKGQYLPLGKVKIISIGPNEKCPPRDDWDPILKKYGRMMQFRDQAFPIAQAMDLRMVLATAPLVDKNGRVALPPIGLPDFVPAPYTDEEKFGKLMRDSSGNEYRMPVERPREKDLPPLIPQDLHDRADGYLAGTEFYSFCPVERINIQPEVANQMWGTFWNVVCRTNPADGTKPTLLIHAKTGETHFYGGLYEIERAIGEE